MSGPSLEPGLDVPLGEGLHWRIVSAAPGDRMHGPPVIGPEGRRIGQLVIVVGKALAEQIRSAGVEGSE